MSEKVVIKTRLPRYAGEKKTHFNAGSLTKVFEPDITKPMDAKEAEEFMKSFGKMQYAGEPAFEVIPASEAKTKAKESPQTENPKAGAGPADDKAGPDSGDKDSTKEPPAKK